MTRTGYIVFGLFFLVVPRGEAQDRLQSSVPLVIERFNVSPADSNLRLQSQFVLPGSDTLLDGKQILIRNKHYTIDYRLGLITLARSSKVRSDTLNIRYRIQPLNLKPSYQFMQFIPWDDQKAAVEDQPITTGNLPQNGESNLFSESHLRRSGSISRSVSVGSGQGLRLDSGLRLQLDGKITSDVEVVAALTDQNIPIQPEGNTQTLNEIDKVYIQVRGPDTQVQLGDFNLNYSGSKYGNYSRKLQGAMLQLSKGSMVGTISGAVSKGKFTTQRFNGQEGLQGPYQLQGEGGVSEIIVLAGTERVWVDGQPMVRGEENDYVIEYGNGQITFTRKRLITGDSRIEVDFEYSDLRFQRNLYSARFSGTGLAERLTYNATLIRESDDRNNLLETSITDEEKEILAGLGDQIDSAFVESGRFVGQGNGAYVLSDTLGQTVFKPVGTGNGDYQVAFTYVGSNQGAYGYAGQGRYRFVGDNMGSFTPKRSLPVAQSQNLSSFFLRFEPSEFIDFSGELGLSHTDRNLWSSLDDNDNFGTAFELKTQLKPKTLRVKGQSLGRIQLRGLWREKDSRFFEISRDQEVEYNRKWDLPDAGGVRGERVSEFGAGYSPFTGAQMRVDLGTFRRSEDFSSNRRLGELIFNRPGFPGIQLRDEKISRDDGDILNGDWTRRRASVDYRVWRFRPILRYDYEKKEERLLADSLSSGFSFDEIESGLSFRVAKPLTIAFGHTLREDQRAAGGFMRDYSRAEGINFKIDLSSWRNLQMNLEITNRSRRFTDASQPEKRTRLADFNASYSPWKQALRTDLRMRVSTTQISATEQFYFEVDDGTGNFRFDPELNEYVPDIFGDFVLRTLSTGQFEPVNDLLLNAKLEIKPRLILGQKDKESSGLKRWLMSMAWSTFFSLDEKSRRDNPWDISLGGDGLFPDQETVFGRYLIRQDLYFFEDIYTRSLRLRLSESLEKNNRLTGGGQKTRRQEYSLRFTSRVSRQFSGEISLAERRIERIFASNLRVSRRILSRGGNLRISYRPKSKLEIAMDWMAQIDKDRVHSPATRTVLIGIKPNISYALRSRGRLRGEVEFSRMRATPDGRIIPYEMADGRQEGENYRWQLGLDYRVSSRVTVLISYLGRRQPITKEFQHLGKAEVKAFF